MPDVSPTILAIDDDESYCKALERLLRSAGYRCRTFTSSEQFLATLPEDAPGCVLLDLSMPGVNGLELQEILTRADRAWPIIFISGHADVPSSVRAMKAGAVDFLTKPCEDEELLSLIEKALERDAATRAERAELQELRTRDAMLTPREHEVFCLVTTGLANKQIGARLGTTVRTIKAHRSKVMEKLEVESVVELVKIAKRLGIEEPSPLGISRSSQLARSSAERLGREANSWHDETEDESPSAESNGEAFPAARSLPYSGSLQGGAAR